MADAKKRYPPGDAEDSDCSYALEAQYEEERLRYCNAHWKDKTMQAKFLMDRYSRHLGGKAKGHACAWMDATSTRYATEYERHSHSRLYTLLVPF